MALSDSEKKRKIRQRIRRSKEIIEALVSQFPAAFSADREGVRPLKVGIFEDVVARTNEKYNKNALQNAVRYYCHSGHYLKAIISRKNRVDLDGADCGAVSASDVEQAKKSLTLLKKSAKNGKPVRAKKKSGFNRRESSKGSVQVKVRKKRVFAKKD